MPTQDGLTKDTLLSGGSFTFNVPLPPGTPMSSTVLGSNSTVFLGNRVQVGVEGSPNARSVIANAGTGTFTAQTDVVMQDDIWSRGNVVFLADRVFVAGNVTTAGTLTRQNNVTIGGTIAEHQSLTAVPTSWTVTFPSSSTNVQLQPGQIRTLAPGGYATVSVATNATLTLSTGTYFFDQLSNEPSGKIVFTGSGPFTLYVRTSFMAKGPIQLPASTVPPTLLVGVAGANDVFLQTQFDGTLVAPNANVTLAAIGTGTYHGAFFGKGLTLQADVKVQHRSNGAGAVTPVAECVIPQATGGYKAVFGYSNSSLLGSVTIPLGAGNQFDPAPANRGQPQVFSSGRRRAQFAVPFDGKALAWTLDGASTTANAGLPQCTAACVQHLTDPTKPRIDTVLTTGAPPLSIAESSAIRDSFRWDDTLPLPETFTNGDPRLYYALVYVTSRETLQTLDFLRIHYSASPLFESEMMSLEAQGISEQFSYPFDGKGQFVYAFIPGATLNAIRAAALDPVEPVEIIHVSSLRPIPATDTGFAAQSSCGLQPVTQCVAQAANGSLRAVFSYTNPSGNPVTVPVGSANAITGGPAGTLPPEAFAAGTHTAVFAVAIATGATVRWTLNGATVSANAQTVRCSAATVAQIGVDSFNPFPPAATPSCRFATPAETQFPSSRLPAAARANTCASLSYQYLGTLGMKWRGVDADADDAPYQAAVAAFALGDATSMSTATVQGGTATVRSALFGKLFRKIVQGVGSVVNGAIDGVRRGLNGVAGFFVGKTRVTVIIDPRNTDSNFGVGTPMQQPFGASFRQPSSLQGMELRASKSVFLSLDKLDASNTGRVDVLNVGGNARICFKAENGAAKIVSPFLPVEFCPGMSVSTSTPVTLHITMPTLNVMAQFTDAQHYMTRVGKFTPSQAEVLAGNFADLFGLLQGLGGAANRDRAFTPCWSFSWANDFGIFLTILGAVAAEHLNDYALDNLVGWLVMLQDAAKKLGPIIIENAGKLHVLTDPFTGTPQEMTAMRASALYDTAATKAQNASNQISLMSQDADDVQNGVATAANLQSAGSSRAGAARAQAQGAIDQLAARQPTTQAAVQDAKDAFDDAAAAIDDLIHALPANSNVIPALQALKDEATNEAEQFNTWLGEIKTAALKVEKVAAAGAGAIVGAALGLTLGQIFQFLAGGDIILPASGGNTNFVDRGIMTHEYGHFALCTLLNSVSSSKFPLAYDEAASEGFITGQNPSATPAVLNEAFADLIASQVIGGTNYARPRTNQVDTTPLTETYCLAVGVAAGNGCIDDNATNISPILPNFDGFERNVRRYVGLFVDAFDGGPVNPVSDRPFNGNVWQGAVGSLTLAATPGATTNDDVVALSNVQRFPYKSWISHALNRGTFLREDNMFGGLSDAMIDNGDNWCARCGVFRLHTVNQMGMPDCPQAWVGPPPTFDIGSGTQTLQCTFDGPCPAGTVTNASTQACEPTCPNPATEHFDPFLLECITTIIVE